MQDKILFISFFSILAILTLYDLIRSIKLNNYKKIWILILVDLGLIISIFIVVYSSLKLNKDIDMYSVEFSNAYLFKSYIQGIGVILAITRIFFVEKLKKKYY